MARSANAPRPVRRRRRQVDVALVEAERDFLQAVIDAAKLLGWAAYHVHDSRHSAAGFPDLVLIHPPRLVVAELKRDGEEPTAAQSAWLEAFTRCGVDAYLWRPADWPAIRVILELRGTP